MEFWDINANLHYLFNITDEFTAYPLGGLGLGSIKATTELRDPFTGQVVYASSTSDTKLGFNVGGGVDYQIADDLYLNGEVKYQIISGYSQAVLSAGIVYKF